MCSVSLSWTRFDLQDAFSSSYSPYNHDLPYSLNYANPALYWYWQHRSLSAAILSFVKLNKSVRTLKPFTKSGPDIRFYYSDGLIDVKQYWVAKLMLFLLPALYGLQSALLHSQPKSTVGTPAYIAPEVLSRKEYDGKVLLLCRLQPNYLWKICCLYTD